jgi:isoleucyl-tRNA synthetase
MGEWLKGNVDWALSRDRFWGTPLPVWICDGNPDHVEWIGGLSELSARAGGLPADFDPHRPYIDEISWACRECDGTMRRSPAVIDVWFDSGAMPFAQWHYPFENEDEFEAHFPADFICEGLDQTRGWFYSLLAISTMLGRGTPFRNVVVNDLILDAEGQKMSKSRGNAVDPWDAIREHGSDALRWYLVTSSNPWVPKRYNAEGVREAGRKLFDTLFNTYRFFVLYANVEDWAPEAPLAEPGEGPILDRWILSRLHGLAQDVGAELEGYQVTRAYRQLADFLNEDLSNWYVRRSRARFWGSGDQADAGAAFRTLWECMRVVSLLVSPVTPFTGDWIHRGLTGVSAHVTRFPEADSSRIDRALEREMGAVRALVTLGRAAREEVRIRVRQPLSRLYAVVGDTTIRPDLLELLREELNVKSVEFLGSAEELVSLAARPNFRALGPRFGKNTNLAAEAIRSLTSAALEAFRGGERVVIEVEGASHHLEDGDLDIVEEARGDLVVKSEAGYTVALDPSITDELAAEGLARELVNRIQRLRKDSGLEITDRIRLGIFGQSEVQEAAAAHQSFIAGETLAEEVVLGGGAPEEAYDASLDVELDGRAVVIGLSRR